MKTTFAVLPALVQRMTELDYHAPTPIQAHAWKNLIEKHQDYVGQAHTGSGKTVAYAVPILQRIDPNDKDIQALVIVPTRELVVQTQKTLFKLCKHLPKIFVEGVMGGTSIEDQQYRLKRSTHILVATPGRLVELLSLKSVNLRRVKTIVLDEADELYAKGFMKDVDKILAQTNDFHKKWLFSATIHGELNGWIRKNLSGDAPKATVATKKVVNPRITHKYIECLKEDKVTQLLDVVLDFLPERGIVFCRTKGDVEHLSRKLTEQGITVGEIHGELNLKEREKLVRLFHQGRFSLLVATDIIARGMDFEALSYVIHYQLPDDPDYYTHRSGRTARAGKHGVSLSLIEPVERKKLRYIQDLLHIDFIQE